MIEGMELSDFLILCLMKMADITSGKHSGLATDRMDF